ncbi:hypothetical protein ACFRCG_38020 [Embleya sp. NPDC056575]|uniref:hypothetical protein n=1 Tax=unclassified Embleya TaxID=2699296 RepID=UPI0036B8B34C
MADAQSQFDANYNYDLSYRTEITQELNSAERNLCGDCAIDHMETQLRNQGDQADRESNDQQAGIVAELTANIESLPDEEFDDLYNQLDVEHRREVDLVVREFADNAVGDEHWDSDR